MIGYEIDDGVASQVSRIAASKVAFYYGDTIVRSTLDPSHEAELARHPFSHNGSAIVEPEEVRLGDEHFLGTSLELAPGKSPSVRLTVLKSYDQATAFLDSLNRLLLALGLAAVAAGSGLVFVISHTFTRPLGSLVAGVRALEKGDFHYALDAQGGDEVAEVTGAFNRMRASLLKTQQELLEAERLATIGRMASSISHDLRHSLAAIVANAEFLLESRLSSEQREELYQEVRIAVNQMTELLDSLLEFSRTRESLRLTHGNVKESVDRVIQTVRTHPRYHPVWITVRQEGNCSGWFDSKKLERALYNLLLNACEATSGENGRINVELDPGRGRGAGSGYGQRTRHPRIHSRQAVRALRQLRKGKRNRPGVDGGAKDHSGSRRTTLWWRNIGCGYGVPANSSTLVVGGRTDGRGQWSLHRSRPRKRPRWNSGSRGAGDLDW